VVLPCWAKTLWVCFWKQFGDIFPIQHASRQQWRVEGIDLERLLLQSCWLVGEPTVTKYLLLFIFECAPLDLNLYTVYNTSVHLYFIIFAFSVCLIYSLESVWLCQIRFLKIRFYDILLRILFKPLPTYYRYLLHLSRT